jgi:energy-coupling factor transporter transmembrane protein EcfT
MTISGNKAKATSWLAGAGALLSLAACYGTLGLIALLSMMGVTFALNVHVWAGVIVAFALLAVLGISLGYRHHRNANPSRLAIVGAVLVIWAMYGSEAIVDLLHVPSFVVELAGFTALIAAAYWDWRLKQ